MKWLWTWLVVLGAVALAGDVVTLAWDPSPSSTVGAYRVYYGTNAAFGLVTNAGLSCTQAVVLPRGGRWFFAATAVDTNGIESVFSNVLEWERAAPPVMRGETWVRLSPVIERSTNLVLWLSLTGAPTWFPATNGQEFFTTRQLTIERVLRVESQ